MKKYRVIGIAIGIIVGSIVTYVLAISSSDVLYDNSNSTLSATTIKGALDELYERSEECTKCSIATGKTYTFSYTGNNQEFMAPCDGRYKLEVWGAQGGSGNVFNSSLIGGKGGYSYGTIELLANTNLYIYVGGQGNAISDTAGKNIAGGFNGGGSSNSTTNWSVASGGGGTDIRIVKDSIYARVIVAGGGGASTSRNDNLYGGSGGYGGGVSGGRATDHINDGYQCGYPGTASAGGSGFSSASSGSQYISNGSFFQGANNTEGEVVGGGGGGWYGGGSGYCSGSGGGSGYVYTAATASNYPSGCLLNSNYYLTSAATVAGNTSFTSPSGGTETGHSGNGYARITYLG